MICCISTQPATKSSVLIADIAGRNLELADLVTEEFYSCCGKGICKGCIHSFSESGNDDKCSFCNSDRCNKTVEEIVEEYSRRVEADDVGAMYALGCIYYRGQLGLQRDREMALGLWKQASKLGSSHSNLQLAKIYYVEGDLKKATFHFEAAAMAGNEVARFNLGAIESESGNMERAFKHWIMSASSGYCYAMQNLRTAFEDGLVSRWPPPNLFHSNKR